MTQHEKNGHVSQAELFAILDGSEQLQPDDVAQAHLRECDECKANIQALESARRSLADTLLFEAELPVPSGALERLQTELRAKGAAESGDDSSPDAMPLPLMSHSAPNEFLAQSANVALSSNSRSKTSVLSSVNTALYSLAAAIMFTGLVSLYTYQGQQIAHQDSLALQASIQGLMDNSRGLESVLQQVAEQNEILTSNERSTAERLYWRLSMVDQRINESESSDTVTHEQLKGLWSDRIDALTELNQLYYANQVATNDGQF